VRDFGKLGTTCIAPTPEAADELYADVLGALGICSS
jgi:hypothetical protein